MTDNNLDIDLNNTWIEIPKRTLYFSLEKNSKPEIVKKYYIDEVVQGSNGFIVKWKRRLIELTAEKLRDEYGIECE